MYDIEKDSRGCISRKEEEEAESKKLVTSGGQEEEAKQEDENTHVSLDPVSSRSWKDWGGVPRVTGEKYTVSEQDVNGTEVEERWRGTCGGGAGC
jgi:hypothetical protein